MPPPSRLRAGERKIGIEAIDHGVIAVAVDKIAQFRETESAVEFGIATAGDVEVEMVLVCGNDLQVEAATSCPDFFRDFLKRTKIAPVSIAPARAILDREVPYHRDHHLVRRLIAESLARLLYERNDDATLDLAPLQMADRDFLG